MVERRVDQADDTTVGGCRPDGRVRTRQRVAAPPVSDDVADLDGAFEVDPGNHPEEGTTTRDPALLLESLDHRHAASVDLSRGPGNRLSTAAQAESARHARRLGELSW